MNDKEQQISYLRHRLQLILTSVDTMDPKNAEPEQLQRMLEMLEQLQMKTTQFKKDWERKGEER